ncbi:Solute carrier family 22 member 13 [Chionoecetes opilio]|uniref:Solute carrier family 22 member 13 n=1 Tax=Chionoecetes opilio TaxID=41210 RepID=A0A8J5CQZ0_CHIOP|nr:Solute carrier family 22 member 13 [Chionoecetes opilio]
MSIAGVRLWDIPSNENTGTESGFDDHVTTQFELVCNRRFLRGLYNSVYYFGAFVGSPLSGWLSDTFGRRKVFVLGSVTFAVLSNIMPWIPNLTAILVLRFILGFSQPAMVQSSYTLVMEVFEERWRSTAGIFVFLPWCFEIMLMGGVSSAVRHWRWQSFYLALPTLVLLLLMWKLDESPRWLIVRGRYTEALQVLRKAARWNNTSLPPTKELRALMEQIREKSADSSSTKREGKCGMVRRVLDSFLILLRTRKIRKITLITFCLYFITSMGYIGLSLGGDLFSTDPFVYMIISGAMDIPGTTLIIPVVERFGRRRSNVVLYFLTAMSLLGLSFIPTSYGRVVMTLALLGRLTLSACYQVIFLHGSELFPTEVRARGMSNASMMARISAVFTSFLLSALPSTWSAAPPIIIGCACLIASALTHMLPETRGAALYDTVAALEATGLSE